MNLFFDIRNDCGTRAGDTEKRGPQSAAPQSDPIDFFRLAPAPYPRHGRATIALLVGCGLMVGGGCTSDHQVVDMGAADSAMTGDAAAVPDGALPPRDGNIGDAAPPPDAASPPDAALPPDAGDLCASPSVETWSGDANRDNVSGYPDHIHATVTWQRTATIGCIDQFVPTGSVTYAHAIPGALCQQSIAPESHAIATTDGSLTIDRSTEPPTYVGSASTTWMITFTCSYPSGPPESSTFLGGGAWFDASGTIDEQMIGELYLDDDLMRCGPAGIPPCTYTWLLTGL